jgi:hypothetical protein
MDLSYFMLLYMRLKRIVYAQNYSDTERYGLSEPLNSINTNANDNTNTSTKTKNPIISSMVFHQ